MYTNGQDAYDNGLILMSPWINTNENCSERVNYTHSRIAKKKHPERKSVSEDVDSTPIAEGVSTGEFFWQQLMLGNWMPCEHWIPRDKSVPSPETSILLQHLF